MTQDDAWIHIHAYRFAVPPTVELKSVDSRAEPFRGCVEQNAAAFLSVAIPVLKAERGRGVNRHGRLSRHALYLIVRDPCDRPVGEGETAGRRHA